MILPAGGQLISPGKLSKAHTSLEGISNCTQCHQLRVPGADRSRCLSCHEALKARIEAGAGYHGQLEEQDCGTCHKEHLGLDFDLIRMDSATFSHSLTGYDLEGAHSSLGCRECHKPGNIVDPLVLDEGIQRAHLDRTYLGLEPECRTCHMDTDPHAGQFPGQSCGDCHATDEWESADKFDHDETSFPLEGRHRSVECSDCHVPTQAPGQPEVIRYASASNAGCQSCHVDPHAGRMTGACSTCHVSEGWANVIQSGVDRGFDHDSTSFSLAGAHGELECRSCHTPRPGTDPIIHLVFPGGRETRAYPAPAHDACTSCHLDAHEGTFDDPSCDRCHTEAAWSPPDFSRAQHSMAQRFELTGAHVVTPCSACHEAGEGPERNLIFRFENPEDCRVCHQADDPHDGAFGTEGCALCHQSSTFIVEAFEHRRLSETGWKGTCKSCHADDDPHEDQFPDRDCVECHSTETYSVEDFDHAETRFPLVGAHVEVPCASCHVEEPGTEGGSLIRYRPLPIDCTDCHGGGP